MEGKTLKTLVEDCCELFSCPPVGPLSMGNINEYFASRCKGASSAESFPASWKCFVTSASVNSCNRNWDDPIFLEVIVLLFISV